MEIFSVIKDISISIATLTTAAIAYNGLGKWHRELKGKASFETARALIQATYTLRNEIAFCRSPFIPASEFPDNYHLLTTKTAEQQGDAYAKIYAMRWQRIANAMQVFDTASLESEALWGASVKEKTDILRNCVIELRKAMDTYISNEYAGGKIFENTALGKETKDKISDHSEHENPLTLKINTAIEGIENEVRPRLNRRQ